MAELGEQRIEPENEDRVAERAHLLTLLFDGGGIETVEAAEVEMDPFARSVIDTSG